MRKLKLQMQITVDGFVAGPEGQLDRMTWDMDEKLVGFINHLTDTSDTILLGRKMSEGFVKYWEGVAAKPSSPEHAFGRKMVDMPKIVFTKTLTRVEGRSVRVESGPCPRRSAGSRSRRARTSWSMAGRPSCRP